jgi:1-pyrroline-5-carboxylate dehydrogenase
MLGNVVLWKPASTSVLANYVTYQILTEAGVPPGVIQFLPGEGRVVSAPILAHQDLAGVSFTGSTKTFNTIWREIGQNLEKYRTYPRVVGETGGKNFHFAHPSADVENFVNNTLRAAFEVHPPARLCARYVCVVVWSFNLCLCCAVLW